MQGYLYIEQRRGDTEPPAFAPRYFISFPFCGLKWFREEPVGESIHRLQVDNSVGGWVYGGNLLLRSYLIEAPVIRPEVLESYIYPFVVEVQQSDSPAMQLRLAAAGPDGRARWMEELARGMQIQNYLISCKECNALPSSKIFYARDQAKNSLLLEGTHLNTQTLGSVVMAIKLNEPDGSLIRQLHLVNAQLADRHIPLVATFMSFAPHLESLSLRDNYISCTGLTELSAALPYCPHLTALNLSSNSIADKGALALSSGLAGLKRLAFFDISRNRLTEAVTRPLALYLTRHDSELTHVSFAYNPIGDSIGTLVALLLTNQPARIEAVDVSFCSIGDAGALELAAAIPHCASIKSLRMSGNFAGSKTTGRLVEAVSQHYEKFGRFQVNDFKSTSFGSGGTGLNDRSAARAKRRTAKLNFSLTLGGCTISQDLAALSRQVLRNAVTHLGDSCVAGGVVLRRRSSLYPESAASVKPTSSRLKQRLNALNANQQSTASPPFVCNSGMGCIRVRLSFETNSACEVLRQAARAVGAHPAQLVLLSASTATDQISFVMFAAKDPTVGMAVDRRRMLATKRECSRVHFADRAHRMQQKAFQSKQPVDLNTILPTGAQALQRLQDLCRLSDPKVRRLGIMTLFLFMPTGGGKGFTTVSLHISAQGVRPSGHNVAAATRELFDYLPSLYPAISVGENVDEGSDAEGGTDEKGIHRVRPRMGAQRHDSSTFDAEDDEDEGRGDRKMDTFDDIFGVEVGEVNEDVDIGASVEKAVLKDLDVRMVAAIADIYEEAGSLDSDSAHFWEGVYGVPKWLKYTEAVIMAPVQEEGIFRAVALRKRLCDAMFKRDIEQLSSLIEQMKAQGVPGGHALVRAELFLTELLTLRHASESLPSLAQGPDDIHIVEKFLLNCARLGYAGPETFTAVELREFLVRWALNENAAEFERDLSSVQRRAAVTNMMISRKMKELKTAMAQLEALEEPEAVTVAMEVKVARMVVENGESCLDQLRRAIQSKSLELIEEALAESAYHNIYDEALMRDAINLMMQLGADSRGMFIKINMAIRNGSHEVLDTAMMEVRRVGWTHSALSSPVLTRILGLRNRIMQEEVTKARVIKIADAVSDTAAISNPAEVMQLLRRVRLLKLEHDPALTDSLALLQSKMRHITGVQHQEEAIIKLLEEKNVTKLSDLLSGRGQGKLVMAAPSPEAMADWLEVLQQVCSKKIALPSARAATNNKPFSAPTPVEEEELECMTVLKAGSLEKAARGNEGVLRNWRLRYFVLQGDEMSYFTKLGGEKKGAIRVTGGAVRALPLSESSGHHNCIELQEGRDLSVIDPELLGEVRKQVNIFRREQLEEELARGIATGTEERLMAALESASSFGISLDGELVAQARSVLMREQHKKLKLDLREALVTLPRRRMQELIRTAKRVRLDPNNAFLRRAILHADKSDVELTLLRARSSMGRVEDAVFKRAVTSVQQLDAKRLSVREKYLLVAILLQWTGYTILRTLVQGSMGAQHCIHVLNQVLASTIVYYIETEPMQLARTVLEGLQSCLDGSEMDSFLADKPTRHLPGGVSMANLSLQFQGANNAITFSLERFPQLRRSTSDSSTPSKAAKGGLFGFLGGSKKKLEEDTGAAAAATTSLTFTTESITAPLSIVGRTVDSKVTELFGGLQVVMMDRPLAQFSASQVKARHSFFSRADVSSICGDLVTCGVTTPSLRDELYLHVCKQINKNPKPLSRYYGWCVFNIYLNCFPPSFGLLPYLKNFVAESLVFESKQSSGSASGRAIVQQSAKRRFSVARGGNEETNMGTSKLVSYATKLIGGIERSYARGIEGAVFQPTNRVIAEFLNGAELEFEVVTMTGSVYRLCLAPRDIDSPLSLLYALYKQLATGLSAPSQADYSSFFEQPDLQKSSALAPATQVGGSDSITNASVTDILLRTFRGFCLYRTTGDDGFAGARAQQQRQSLSDSASFADEDIVPVIESGAPRLQMGGAETISSSSDLHDFEIQPPERRLVDWGEDLLWELLLAGGDIASPSPDASPMPAHRKSFISSAQSPGSESGASHINPSIRKRFVLRMRTAVCTEIFSDQFGQFEDALTDRDIVTSKKLWSSWLAGSNSAAGNDSEEARTSTSPVASPPVRSPSVHESKLASFSLQGRAVLPADHIRVDLLFAEESRYVNAKKYVNTQNSQAYLNALQLVLSCHCDRLADCLLGSQWGGGQHSVLFSAPLSVRPCMQAAIVGGISGSGSQEFSPKVSGAIGGNRRGSLLSSRRISFMESPRDREAPSTPTTLQPAIKNAESITKPISFDGMTSENKGALRAVCREAGISLEVGKEDTELATLVNWIGQFQGVALATGVSVLAPRFRYMIKRAYLGYVAAFPLFGSHFFDALLTGTHMDASTQRKLQQNAPPSPEKEGNKPPQPVSVAVSGEGVFLLSRNCWEVVFIAPLFDITSMNVLPPVRVNESIAGDEDLDERFTLPLFSMNVNGMEVQLLSSAAAEIRRVVEAFCLEALSSGSFPHGTEGGNDVYEVGASFVSASDQKEIMKRFLHDFPLLPNPPPPPMLPRSSSYFSAPLSRRAILAEERAEEERRELELSKRAAESHVAKHMAKLETGRQVLSRIMSEEEEEEDEDAQPKDAETASAARVDTEARRQARITAALSGLSDRLSNVSVVAAEPFSVRGQLAPGDHSQFDRGKFHPPPLLRESIERKAAAEMGSVSLGWPAGVRLNQPPKAFAKVAFLDGQWPPACSAFLRQEAVAATDRSLSNKLLGGMFYVHDEYISRSMALRGVDTEDFDITEEGAYSTALSMTQPSAAPASRRGSQAAYSTLMRRGSTVMPADDAVGVDDPGDALPTRRASVLLEQSRTLGTFAEQPDSDEDDE